MAAGYNTYIFSIKECFCILVLDSTTMLFLSNVTILQSTTFCVGKYHATSTSKRTLQKFQIEH